MCPWRVAVYVYSVCVCVWEQALMDVLMVLGGSCLNSDSPHRETMTCLPHRITCLKPTDESHRWNGILCVGLHENTRCSLEQWFTHTGYIFLNTTFAGDVFLQMCREMLIIKIGINRKKLNSRVLSIIWIKEIIKQHWILPGSDSEVNVCEDE